MNGYSQVTSLTVNNPNRGYLSTQISSEDKKNIENLKVTGQINNNDLKFIGTLMESYKLHGIIDLEDVIVIGDTEANDNRITQGYFKGTAKHIKLPKSLVYANNCLDDLTLVDTVTIGGEAMPTIHGRLSSSYSSKKGFIKHVIVREGVREIGSGYLQHNNVGQSILESVQLPSTLKKIGSQSFYNCNTITSINLPDSITEIDIEAFRNVAYFADTVWIPKNLLTFNPLSFCHSENKRTAPYKNQVVYIPESVTTIGNIDHFSATDGDRVIWHVDNVNPPTFESIGGVNYGYHVNKLNAITVYVPKSSVEIYQTHPYWKYTNIIAEPIQIQSISLDCKEKQMLKGKTDYLYATIEPTDADDPTVIWKSSDPSIVTVKDGSLTAQQTGSAYIFATSKTNPSVKDSCLVTVSQPVKTVKLNNNALSIYIEEGGQLIATITPSDADNKTIKWTSVDTSIATVDDSGNVTGIKAGETWIKAISEDNSEACDSCKVTVLQPVTGITLDKTECTMAEIGQSEQLEATVLPEDANNKTVNWKSSDESVCYVSNGKLVATGYGTCIIIATTEEGGFMATCKVTVQEPIVITVTSVSVNKQELTLKVGEEEQLSASVSPANAENKTLMWLSSDETIATVDSEGNVTALQTGETWIKAISEGNAEVSDSCLVSVRQPATGIMLSPEECTLSGIGSTAQLTVLFQPENASNQNVTWKSLNEKICTVTDGTVTAVGKGTSVVIATSEDGGFMAYCTVIVEEAAAIQGDVNQDGKVDISDIVAIINTIAGDTTYRNTANVNNDSNIDISDIVAVINIIAVQ